MELIVDLEDKNHAAAAKQSWQMGNLKPVLSLLTNKISLAFRPGPDTAASPCSYLAFISSVIIFSK